MVLSSSACMAGEIPAYEMPSRAKKTSGISSVKDMVPLQEGNSMKKMDVTSVILNTEKGTFSKAVGSLGVPEWKIQQGHNICQKIAKHSNTMKANKYNFPKSGD